jgi:hypothetical protein
MESSIDAKKLVQVKAETPEIQKECSPIGMSLESVFRIPLAEVGEDVPDLSPIFYYLRSIVTLNPPSHDLTLFLFDHFAKADPYSAQSLYLAFRQLQHAHTTECCPNIWRGCNF